MSRYLLDTNHVGRALDSGIVRDRMRQLLLAGNRLGTCVPVLCEVQVGINQTARQKRNTLALAQLVSELLIWPVDLELVSYYAAARAELKSQGRIMSQIDLMIVSIARQQNAVVVTTDRDFEAFPDVKKENWITQ